jgi:arylsulfatase
MIARWPGKISPGTNSEHLSYFTDMFPTFADVAGIDADFAVDGISMLPELTGRSDQAEHDFLYWEFPSYGGQQAIRYGDWKGVRTGLFKDPDAPIQLYNLKDDLAEEHNLAEQHPEIVYLLDSLMKTSHIPSETFPFEALDNN